MVAEQIPTELAADVSKNTNLKVMHRIVAEDDRVAVRGSTNFEQDEVAMWVG